MAVLTRNHVILIVLVYVVSMSLVYYSQSTSRIIHNLVQTEPAIIVTSAPPAPDASEAVFVIDQTSLPQINTSSLSPQVLQFLTLTSTSGASVFVIEPCILWKACTAKEKNKLHRRRAVPDFARACSKTKDGKNYITTLAAFELDLRILQSDDLRMKLTSEGFNVSGHRDLSVRAGRTTHLIVRKKKSIIHVVIFFQRNFFLQIHSLPTDSYGIHAADIRFGKEDAAFENIGLSARLLNGQTVLIPAEHLRFLFEIRHSKWRECRHDLAAKHNKKYPLTGEPLVDLISTLEAIRNVTYHTLLPVWMDGGSLIGWARHCGGE